MGKFQQLKNRFVLYRPSPDDVATAFSRSKHMGVTFGSYTKGSGRMTGFLGEIAFSAFADPCDYVGDSSYTHDFEVDGIKVDVKSKICSTPPKLEYVATVNQAARKELKADLYFFTRVSKDFSKVWLLGWAAVQAVTNPKYYKEKGETDSIGFTYLCDGYHLPIKNLRRPDSFESFRRCQKKSLD